MSSSYKDNSNTAMEDEKSPSFGHGSLQFTVELSGGLELLFENERKLSLSLQHKNEHGEPTTIANLVKYLCDEVMKDDRRDMFVVDENVRPGILVLINDADWELEGGPAYQIQTRDNILFVSTLHGG